MGVIVNTDNTLSVKVNNSLAKIVKNINTNRKLDLGLEFNQELLLKLSAYNRMLDRLEDQCSTCYNKYTTEQIISVIKTNINKV